MSPQPVEPHPTATGFKAPLKRAARAALFAFVALFGTSLLGWFPEVLQWANDTENVTPFPDPAVLVKFAISAFVGAVTGFVSFVVNLAEDARGGSALFGAKRQRND